MSSWGFGWLKDAATARTNPPAEVMEAARAQQGVTYMPQPPEPVRTPAVETARPAVNAVAPRPAMPRHTIPPQQSASFRGPEYGCVGLCIGGTCATCDEIADEISKARRIKVPAIRDVLEAALHRRINALYSTKKKGQTHG